jgi:hypothetical protein
MVVPRDLTLDHIRTTEFKSMPKNRRKPWTPDEDEALRSALEQGVSPQRLSARFDRPVKAIAGRAKFLGIAAKRIQRLANT